MNKIRTFRDFIEVNGKNPIQLWLSNIPVEAAEEFNDKLVYLEALRTLPNNTIKQLSGKKYSGLLEIRYKANKIQYRPICCHGPNRGEITLLAGATKKGGKFVPLSVLDTALRRMKDLDLNGRTDEHANI